MEAILRLPYYLSCKLDNASVRYLIASFSGASIALAFAPIFFWPALFAMSLFAFTLFKAESKKEARIQSFLFTFFLYFTNLYWVANAFTTVGLGFLTPLAYLGLPAYMASLPAIACYYAWKWGKNLPPLQQSLLFASLFCLASVPDFFGDLGFPWVNYGYALPLTLLQSTSLWGIEGLSFLTVFASLIPFARNKIYAGILVIIFGILTIFGHARLQNESLLTPYNLRLIQPSIAQENKWEPDQLQKNLQIQGLLSQMDGEKPIQAVLWPEASVPVYFQKYPELQQMLGNAAPNGGYVFLGAPREDNNKFYNSLVVLNDQGAVKGAYDKKHLVPFGEYVAFRNLLPGVEKLTHGSRDYSPGTLPGIIHLEGLPPFRALICYEALFSREIQSEQNIKAEWLLNMTNDAWYGNSSGPHQHLRIALVRAIEQGLPLVRVANNGISAVIDPYGRIQNKLELNDVGIIDFTLPQPISQTLYNKHGNFIIFVLIVFLSILLGSVYFWKRKRTT